MSAPRFPQTHCSQCGGTFGPGNAGFSHCDDHDDPFATWREEDEAKDPAARRLVAWIVLALIAALAVGAAYLCMGNAS